MNEFKKLALNESLLKALEHLGYEAPSPIQEKTIPLLLAGKDVVGQAQTGTGKTAAFALPLLQRLQMDVNEPQVLVLTPTRELAIQVAEAWQRYAHFMKGFHVLPIYGGQDYSGQIRGLKRGAHVVVGTPGRVMDHMRKGTLKLHQLQALVLDEADEMLRMGFIEDVEWIMEQTPEDRQIALFSATMPKEIRRIAQKYLNEPEQVTIKVKTTTAETIRQRYWLVRGTNKLDALTRLLEAEPFEGMIIFVRTKTASADLAERLLARGYASYALHGDMNQKQRERTVEKLKSGDLDIVVATDVAARGLDVDRVSHVINYDIPYDTESYVHRIGRTGRAGRDGDAILFVTPREKRMLFAIEKTTRKPIEQMQLPSTDAINEMRVKRFQQRILDTFELQDLKNYKTMLESFSQEHAREPLEVAAALAHLFHGEDSLWLDEIKMRQGSKKDKSEFKTAELETGMNRYRVAVGYKDKVKPGNIVGAIANEAGIPSSLIGRIEIKELFSLVDISADITFDTLKKLQNTMVAGRPIQLRAWEERADKKEWSKKGEKKDSKKRDKRSSNKGSKRGRKKQK